MQSGDFLCGQRYELRDFLGRGGYAVVWKAVDHRLQQEVALKVLNPLIIDPEDNEATPDLLERRFANEVHALARLNHPHIVRIYDAGRDGVHLYFSMELLTGGTLARRLLAYKQQGRRVGLEEALGWLRPLAAALDAAHTEGLVHRDIKPQNILFRGDGRPVLTDFGLAKVLHGLSAGGSMRVTGGKGLGTLGYMAPEQIDEDDEELGPVGPAADVFALAAVLGELLMGEPVFRGSTERAINHKVLSGERGKLLAGLPAETPAAVRAGLQAGLALRPQARPQRAGAWLAGLEGGLAAAAQAAERQRREAQIEALAGAGRYAEALVQVGALQALVGEDAGVAALRGQVTAAQAAAAQAAAVEAAAEEAARRRAAAAQRAEQLLGQSRWVEALQAIGELTALGAPAETTRGLQERALAGLQREAPRPEPPRPTPQPAANVRLPHIVTGKPPLEMAWGWVPGGAFTMGDDTGTWSDEKPAHRVEVAGFWLGRYAVTNGQYRLFVEAGGYRTPRWWTEAGWAWRGQNRIEQPGYWTDGKWNGAQQPVVGVSWHEAVAFCAWGAEATGEGLRLPTEAEWERAARGEDGREWPWGKAEPTQALCNFDGKVGKTTAVGQYSPAGDGPYGHADLVGNVWEWVQSRYQDYPYRADDGRNEPDGTDVRVVRGGSWYYNRNYARAAARDRIQPDNGYYNVGFRCASTPF